MANIPLDFSFLHVAIAVAAFFILKRVYYEFTTGARRRRMIKENGCEPAYHYQHVGILGKTLGLDFIRDNIKASKGKRLHRRMRERNFSGDHKTVQFQLLTETITSTIEPENVKAMLSLKFNDFALDWRRNRTFLPVFGHGIFNNNGPAWERSRALIRPNFTRQQVADLDTFEFHVQHLIESVPPASEVDLQELFFNLTMDSATEFLFGQSTNTLCPGLTSKLALEFSDAFVYVTKSMATEFQSAGLSRWIPDAKYRKYVKIILAFADETIQDALRRHTPGDMDKKATPGKERYVFLHELLQQTQDPYVLRSELLNVLLAGRDTTAGLLSNTWWVLARRPDVWEKLREEVDALKGERPDYSQIKDMKYLRYVLNESLRLMPVVPSNSRMAVRDTVLPLGGGKDGKSPLFIPKGSAVAYSTWSMHRREDIYGKDSTEFKPERWEHLRPGWEYLPFNGGPRICLGQQFALLEASYATIRLMQKFKRIEPRDERPWSEWVTLTLASGVGTKVALFEE